MSKKDENAAKGKAEKKEAPKAKGGGQPKPKKEKGGEAAAKKGAPKGAEAAEADGASAVPVPPPRLRERYVKDVLPRLMTRFEYRNRMQAPRLEKIVLNVGLGAAVQNPKLLDSTVEEIAQITGQRPVITKARKSIANFKLREGMSIGVTVTLRRERMWEFLDRLINLGLPRVRDFRGVSPRAFDGVGNYTLGLKEQIVFPEVDFDKVEHVHGMNVTFVTSAKSNEEAKEMLGMLGMPFRT
ncbi:MAG: 50S ribosomal protein L5 [Polyangiaceae bacterium]|nr:50S ribosomal protein L5 [Polyangiaceae bacterium]